MKRSKNWSDIDFHFTDQKIVDSYCGIQETNTIFQCFLKSAWDILLYE